MSLKQSITCFALFPLAAALVLSPALAQEEDPCTLPGVTVMTDPAGDQQGAPLDSWADILSLALAEPASTDGVNRLVFTYRVSDLSAVPPNSLWSVRFSTDVPPANGDEDYFVAMLSGPDGSVHFIHGSQVLQNGTAPRVWTPAGELDPSSSFTPDGTITLVLDKSKIPGLDADQFVFSMLPHTRADLTPTDGTLPFTTGLVALILDTTGAPDDYTLLGNESCSEGKSGLLGIFGGVLSPFTLVLLGLAARGRRSLGGPMLKATQRFGAALVLAAFTSFGAAASTAGQAPAIPAGLRTILASNIPDSEPVRAVAMLGRVPTASDVSALRELGLIVQPLSHLPMALTKGTVPQLQRAVSESVARDVYLDMPLQYHSKESTAAMSADITRALGFDGRGVGIAIVDSGIDASHPDLVNRVVRNVRVYSPEYLDIWGLSEPTGVTWPYEPYLVIAFDDLPYNNTDTIGHGTHVAGIAAADASANPELIGVAPGASVIGYSTGEVLFIFTALASFDDILGTHKEHNIRVINNSWGSRYRLFDPNEPINVATRALYDAGITIAFSAGNDGDEMTTNPNSMAPWVINVGSTTVQKQRSDFSSAGLMFDNSAAVELDADHHAHFDGDGLGLSHPDVSAPGSSIVSTCTATGWICTGRSSASVSGTSMSSPHAAGLAAVLLQARPELTPDQVRQVMQLATVPILGAGRRPVPFWQSGYGFVDAKLALDLVLRSDFSQALLDTLQAARDAEVLAARAYRVVASDHWNFVSLGATVMGLETRSFPVQVSPETTAIRAGAAFPSDLGIVAGNVAYEWSLTLLDPDGKAVATSEPIAGAGVQILHADFQELGIQPKSGAWTIEAAGVMHIAQPALLWGHTVTVTATQLARQDASASKEQAVPEGSGLLLGALPLSLLLPFGLLVLWRRAPVRRIGKFSRRVS